MFPGIEDGGIRIDVGDEILTKYTLELDGYTRYTLSGDRIDARDCYVGENLDVNLIGITDAIITFQTSEFDRFTEISTRIDGKAGNKVLILSFCDGENVRIALQPASPSDQELIPTKSTVGHPIDPDEMCYELINCYGDCVAYFETAFADRPELAHAVDEVNEWANGQIQRLENAIDTTK